MGFPSSSDGKESACSAGDLGSIPRLGRSPGSSPGMQPTPVFLRGEFHGQRSLAATVLGIKKSQTRVTNIHTHVRNSFSGLSDG